MPTFSKTIKKNLFLHFHFHFLKKSSLKTYRISNEPVESSNLMIPYNFELPIYQDEEEGEDDFDLHDELSRLLEHESKSIQPHQEPV